MTVTIPIVAADGTQSTVVLPAPVVTQSGVSTIAAYSDLTLVFLDHTSVSPAQHLPEFETVSTPNGPGFQFVISDTADVTPWDTAMKCVLAKAKWIAVAEETEQWDFYVYLPSQEIVTSWNGGVLWEFHTGGANSGNDVTLDNTGRGPTNPSFRFGVETAGGGGGADQWIYAPLAFDAWHHFTINVKWSEGSDGFYQLTLDGTQYINRTGPTYYAADTSQTPTGGNANPFLQFGFYADIGSANGVASVGNNQVTIAGITYTTS